MCVFRQMNISRRQQQQKTTVKCVHRDKYYAKMLWAPVPPFATPHSIDFRGKSAGNNKTYC